LRTHDPGDRRLAALSDAERRAIMATLPARMRRLDEVKG
jgi:hypothetical protein